MSTAFDQTHKDNHLSFDSINRQVQQFDAVTFMSEGAVETPMTRMDRLVTVYASARPILAALAAIPLIPSTWHTVLTIFVSTLDGVSASFKAGKDLAIAPVDGGTQAGLEPKPPVG